MLAVIQAKKIYLKLSNEIIRMLSSQKVVLASVIVPLKANRYFGLAPEVSAIARSQGVG